EALEHAGDVAARLVAQERVDGVALVVLGAQVAREEEGDTEEGDSAEGDEELGAARHERGRLATRRSPARHYRAAGSPLPGRRAASPGAQAVSGGSSPESSRKRRTEASWCSRRSAM